MATLTDVTPDETAHAQRVARQQAETFEQALRDRERQEREDRLTRLAWGGEESIEPQPRQDSSEQVQHLERQVEILASFHRAVLGSRGWQILQLMRRLMGRAW
jgi:hypothetical protein